MGEMRRTNVVMWLGTGVILVIVVVGMILMVYMGAGSSGTITTMEELRTAVREKTAFSCKMITQDGGDMEVQATEGFARVKLTMQEADMGEGKQYLLVVEGEGSYVWDDAGTFAYREENTAQLEVFLRSITTVPDEGGTAGDFVLQCGVAREEDFLVPEGVEFLESGEVESGDGGGDELGD